MSKYQFSILHNISLIYQPTLIRLSNIKIPTQSPKERYIHEQCRDINSSIITINPSQPLDIFLLLALALPTPTMPQFPNHCLKRPRDITHRVIYPLVIQL